MGNTYIGKVKKGPPEAEGKTKRVHENRLDPDTVIIQFKPDITARDGEKKETIAGKDEIDCTVNDNFFLLLKARGIPTHYLHRLNTTEFLAKKLVRKAPFEVVTRRVAYGSFLDRNPDVKAGHHFKVLRTEFFYKDDFFNDPMLNDGFIKVKDKKGYFAAMRRINEQAFLVAEEVLRQLGYQLVDWKQEYGWPLVGSEFPLIAEDLIMIDEITAGNTRIWPIKVKKLDLMADNLMNQLDPSGMLDKQLFRDGKDLKTVKNAFEALAKLTNQFVNYWHPPQ